MCRAVFKKWIESNSRKRKKKKKYTQSIQMKQFEAIIVRDGSCIQMNVPHIFYLSEYHFHPQSGCSVCVLMSLPLPFFHWNFESKKVFLLLVHTTCKRAERRKCRCHFVKIYAICLCFWHGNINAAKDILITNENENGEEHSARLFERRKSNEIEK